MNRFSLLLAITISLSLYSLKAETADTEPIIFPMSLDQVLKGAGGARAFFVTHPLHLKKNQKLHITIDNPIEDPSNRTIIYHNIGYQDRIPDSSDLNQPSIYHHSPLLEDALGYEIWYGDDSWLGDISYFMHWSSQFPRSWTPDCIEDDGTESGLEETSNPLLLKIKATSYPGISYVYFICYDRDDYQPEAFAKYTQKYFYTRLKIIVE